MQLTISTESGDVISLEVDADESIENVKALLEVESQIPLSEQQLLFNGQQLPNATKLNAAGVKPFDLLFLVRRRVQQRVGGGGGGVAGQQRQPQAGGSEFAEAARNLIAEFGSNPARLRQLEGSNPQLAAAVRSNDLATVEQVVRAEYQRRQQEEAEQQRRLAMLDADPFNPELQRQIEEHIRMNNVNQNMEQAMEHNPELFGQVWMLYIDVEVNGHHLKAFVDSGAQSTIMSQACAERCGLMRLVDRRWAGVARGVGTSKIIGRVHVTPLKIGKSFFPTSFTILENQEIDLLLGLDMLRKHRCQIDLAANCLRIGEEAAAFLSEKDIPKRFEDGSMDVVETPGPSASAPPAVTTPAPAASAPAPQPVSAPQPIVAAPPRPAATVQQPQPQRPVAQPVDEAAVQQLMGLGFPREAVVQALQRARGNTELAASLLFG